MASWKNGETPACAAHRGGSTGQGETLSHHTNTQGDAERRGLGSEEHSLWSQNARAPIPPQLPASSVMLGYRLHVSVLQGRHLQSGNDHMTYESFCEDELTHINHLEGCPGLTNMCCRYCYVLGWVPPPHLQNGDDNVFPDSEYFGADEMSK